MNKLIAALLMAALAAGCSSREAADFSEISSHSADWPATSESEPKASASETSPPDLESSAAEDQPIGPAGSAYVNQLVSQCVLEFAAPAMTEYERAKAAFDYMIEHTYLDEPIGLELWRLHDGETEAIPFLEQRAISPLRFGVGMCEDYAAALTLLLRGLGLEALYVPGLTYSLEGHLVDHAWTMVRIDGVWYHLDSQLEDNISLRRSTVRYRYFLKSDATLSASHLWGQRLIDSGLLTPEQNAELAERYPAPVSPQDYATPPPRQLENAGAPDWETLRAEAAAELTAYENKHGPLAPLTLDVIPPIFGLEGFGPPDGESHANREE